jgi:hypothetical protein
VRKFTTGENTGLFLVQAGTARQWARFRPHEIVIVPLPEHAELLILKITGT